MIVLHLIPHLLKGGAERQLTYLTSYWAHSGGEIHIAYLAGTPIPDGIAESGVQLHPLAHASNYDPMLFVRLIRLIWQVKPALIHTWLLQMDILGGLAAILTNTPWVLREPASGLHWSRGLKARLRRWIGAKADAIVSNSIGGDTYWIGVTDRTQRFIIGNIVPVEQIQASPKSSFSSLGLAEGQSFVLLAGRLDQQKNFEVVVRAFRQVVDRFAVCAVIFGEGPDRQRLEDLIDSCGMQGKILLPGVIPNIWGALKLARAFVSMSRYEGHPNAVLEAMACGCPLIVSGIASHREFLDDSTAVLVGDYEDPKAVAEAISSVLGDRNQAAIRSQSARSRLDSSCCAAAICERYDAVYEVVLERRSKGRR